MIEKLQNDEENFKNFTNIKNFQNGIKKVWDFIMQDKLKAE